MYFTRPLYLPVSYNNSCKVLNAEINLIRLTRDTDHYLVVEKVEPVLFLRTIFKSRKQYVCAVLFRRHNTSLLTILQAMNFVCCHNGTFFMVVHRNKHDKISLGE